MITPEVRPNLSPNHAAYDFLLDAISQLEEEWDAESNTQTAIRIEESLDKYNHALDTLTHENNIPFIVRFLRDQVTELSTQVKNQEDYKNIQRLSCLAANLNRTA